MVEHRINIRVGVAPLGRQHALACANFRTDQSEDCGSNPHLGVTVPNFFARIFKSKSTPSLEVAAAFIFFIGWQKVNPRLVHGD